MRKELENTFDRLEDYLTVNGYDDERNLEAKRDLHKLREELEDLVHERQERFPHGIMD